MTQHTVPVVGMHFRPPAKAILAVLPAACPLRIMPEADNPHDANALAVHVASTDIPAHAHEQLESEALNYGFTAADILAEGQWHLGYVKATDAAYLCAPLTQAIADGQTIDADAPHYYPGHLSFDGAGKPTITLTLD